MEKIKALSIIGIVGLITALWCLPFNFVRDFWIIGTFEPDIYLESPLSLYIEFLGRAIGYTVFFYVCLKIKVAIPIYMALIAVAITLVCWPIALLLVLHFGWRPHLVALVQVYDVGLAGYGFACIFEFALAVTVQLTGWKLLYKFQLIDALK